MLAIWFITQYKSMGSPLTVQLIEIGPGKGTLMRDMLRTLNRFDYIRQAIESVYLVEPSPTLRLHQQSTLSNYSKIHWTDAIEDVPEEFSFIIVHELLDALPVFKFQLADKKWKEIKVDYGKDGSFIYALDKNETEASAALLNSGHGSLRYDPSLFQEGDQIEVSPEVWRISAEIADRVQTFGGSALFVDYGKDGISDNSVRGVKDHQFCGILDKVGECDITADVDFGLVRDACSGSCDVYGPIKFGIFSNI